jgi:hypothetical protein
VTLSDPDAVPPLDLERILVRVTAAEMVFGRAADYDDDTAKIRASLRDVRTLVAEVERLRRRVRYEQLSAEAAAAFEYGDGYAWSESRGEEFRELKREFDPE